MASELISFRLSNSELEWLRGQCEPGESLNLAAKRLLLSISQGVDTLVNRTVDTVDTPDIREELEQLQTRLDERFEELEQRLGKLNA
ncbi:hypothetical protein VB834_09285 [Limnoraphis robusta Tam1]|uniref:Uncharacterized protein n=1 Tax=Limnoraphis robusta CCNP1315 TaxID=3110306 RepID=A0ABU5TX98_9CYAN|nr:hypothetical protein [Limnoraphis robusta]MEA5500356.1 hypothetical protein [Limnoraphis robusta BA-68 BA1]MEA5519562.1 hypothetical protein [Limnoraphis robusta CCNP1315]MEA5539226.1 hypothetical protein [Limnoraphis robusta Tam1]MEA5545830.1 hypothetical protein [Limnoraphis robusta CCNP1324]